MIDKEKLLTILRSARTRKYGLRFLITLAVIGVLGFLVLPPIVKSVLLDKLSVALDRPVSIKSISINPYALSLTVEGVAIEDKVGSEAGRPFVAFDQLYVNLESTSLFRGGVVIGELRLLNPRLHITRLGEQRYSFSDLLDAALAQPPSDGPPPRFSVNNIQIIGGGVEFDDQPMHEKHTVSEIQLSLPFISNMAYAVESFVEPAFAAKINGAPLAIKGRSKPFADSLESEVGVNLDNLQLADFIEYSPVRLPVKMKSGALDSKLNLTFQQEKNKAATLGLAGSVDLRNLDLLDLQDRPLLAMKHLEFKLTGADLLAMRFDVERFALEAPVVHARVSRQGDINWLEFLRSVVSDPEKNDNVASGARVDAASAKVKPAANAGAPSSPTQDKTHSKVPVWSVAEVQISGGAVHWLDESHGAAFDASIESIEVNAKKLSSAAGQPGEFDIAWRMKAGEWLKVDRFAIKGGYLDLGGRAVKLTEVEAKGAQLLFRRLPDGRVDWLKPPALRAAQASQQSADAPWALSIEKYTGEGIGLRFEDKAVKPVATQVIEGLGFTLENLTTVPGEKARIASNFKFNRKGEIGLKGWASVQPIKAELSIDAKAIELLPLQPYFGERLNIDVTRGQISLSGDLNLKDAAANQGGKSGKAPEMAVGFTGQATVGDFQAVDKINSADFLRWKSFHFGKIDVQSVPLSLSIGEIALADFFARVIVSPEGKLNLMHIVRQDTEGASELVPGEGKNVAPAVDQAPPSVAKGGAELAAAEGRSVAPIEPGHAPMIPLKIGKITLQGGTVRFTDNFVKPNYTANLRQIAGRITGLSSEPGTVASLDLRGSYDNVAPLNVTASINPLSAKPYLDLQADVKGIEMTSFSSYSGKYAGYAIDKGKLSLFVKYKIENDQLAAENRLFIDQLTFGERIESPEATKLPVTLAVSLLKNRNGEIDLNLPISGSLNDPQFSIGGLVIKVIVNLFAKAVTSPFALLGAAFGGGEELSTLEFMPGLARLDANAEKRLESLRKVMGDRPAIKLEIEGYVDGDNDREGLKRARIDQKVRALKREELTRKGIETDTVEAIEIGDKEYATLLERVYRNEKFPKPRNVVGLVKTLPVDEMEKLMLANSSVDDDDLRELGDARASAVRAWLLEREVASERVFLLPSRIESGGAKTEASDKDGEKKTGPRVIFGLK